MPYYIPCKDEIPRLPRSVEWTKNSLRLLDQNSLFYPYNLRFIELTTPNSVIDAIRTMSVRGAPAIGLVGGYGLVLAAMRCQIQSSTEFYNTMQQIVTNLQNARPTAVNLVNVTNRIISILDPTMEVSHQKNCILKEMIKIHAEEETTYRLLSERGSDIIPEQATILTHCNTGALATGTSFGTALGIIQISYLNDKIKHVYVTETRPILQGLRITAWEFQQLQNPCTVLVDNAVGYLLATKKISCILIGADRILTNESPSYFVLNKIGTLSIAILAKYYKIPLIVASPYSSFDYKNTLSQIIIETRASNEITHIQNHQISPNNINTLNPAFDITPPDLITAIVTEKKIIYPNSA